LGAGTGGDEGASGSLVVSICHFLSDYSLGSNDGFSFPWGMSVISLDLLVGELGGVLTIRDIRGNTAVCE
jgi:hypothetical protein